MSALWMFYLFYFLNALGYVCGGPLPNQVLLSRWFDKTRGHGCCVSRNWRRRRAGAAVELADAALAGGYRCRRSA